MNLNGTSSSFDGNTGATASLTQNFAIEDKISHKVDNSALGLVRVKANELFVTIDDSNELSIYVKLLIIL